MADADFNFEMQKNKLYQMISDAMNKIPDINTIDATIKEKGVDFVVDAVYEGVINALQPYLPMFKALPEIAKRKVLTIINEWLQMHSVAYIIYNNRKDLINYGYTNPELWLIIAKLIQKLRKFFGLGNIK